jgi:hypothetical protein
MIVRLARSMAGHAFCAARLMLAVALFSVAPASAAPGDTFPLDRFTDVTALMNAVSSARTATQALLSQNPSRNDRAHLEKALASLDAVIAVGFTAANLEKFFNDARQAIDALENVTAGKPIAGDLAEAVRAATAKFLENVERAIPRLADARTQENATKDLAKAKDDFARGVAAITAGRRGEAPSHFRQAMRRMIGYPLVPVQTSPIPPIRLESGVLIFTDTAGSEISRVAVAAERFVTFSPSLQRVMVYDGTGEAEPNRNVEVYDNTGALVLQRNDVLPLSLAVADNGSYAAYASDWQSNLNEFIFYDASGAAISQGPQFRSVARANGCYLSDTLFLTAYNWLPYDPQDHIHQTIYLRGIDVLTGQQRFIASLSYIDVRMREFDFLSVNPKLNEIYLWLLSRSDGELRYFVFDGNGNFLGSRNSR